MLLPNLTSLLPVVTSPPTLVYAGVCCCRRASLAKLEPLHHSPTPDAGAMLMARASGGGGDRIGVHDASGVFQVLTAKQVEAIIAENEMLKVQNVESRA